MGVESSGVGQCQTGGVLDLLPCRVMAAPASSLSKVEDPQRSVWLFCCCRVNQSVSRCAGASEEDQDVWRTF